MYLLRRFLVAAAVTVFASALSAQQFPSKPLKIVTSDGPGSIGDVVIRLLADEISKTLGQPLIIENKPGASGTVASNQVAKAPADGYTLLVTPAFTQVVVPAMKAGTLPYDATKDLIPVSLLAGAPFVFLVKSNSSVYKVEDLVEQARSKKTAFTTASAGPGTLLHLTLERFRREAKISDANYVPFKTSIQAMLALANDEVDVVVEPIASALPLIRSGKIRPIGITAPQRSPIAPEIPTLVESGYKLTTFGWLALLAPGGTPPAAIKKVADAVGSALVSKAIQERLKPLALTPMAPGTSELRSLIDAERRIYYPLVGELGLTESR